MIRKLSLIFMWISLFSLNMMAVSAIDREECGTFVGTYEVAGENRPENLPDEIRVYPLHIGDTLVPYEQFYGGTELSGFRGGLQLLNSEHFFWVPIYMFLIDHPVVGPIVVDTAVNNEMVYNYEEYYSGSGGIFSRLLGEAYILPEEQQVVSQLARIGYTPEDIELVILTHTHDDHVGGLPIFQHARIVLSENEFQIIEIITSNSLIPVNTKFYEDVTCWETIAFTDDGISAFESSQDLLGDGSITILPTYGHTEGSISVLVNMGDYQLLLPTDTIYTMRHLDPTQALQFIPDTDPDVIIDSVQRLKRLWQEFGNVVVVPSHDHTGYLDTMLGSLQTCGYLTPEERAQIKVYEATLFDDEGQVREEFVPQFVAGESDAGSGSVETGNIDVENSEICEP